MDAEDDPDLGSPGLDLGTSLLDGAFGDADPGTDERDADDEEESLQPART